MFADACQLCGIFFVIFTKNRGLAILLLFVLPAVFFYTRHVQKRMLASQLSNRAAIAKASGHVPETKESAGRRLIFWHKTVRSPCVMRCPKIVKRLSRKEVAAFVNKSSPK